MLDLLIKNGHIVLNDRVMCGDIGVRDGKIVRIASQIAAEYKDCDVVLNQGVPEVKKVKSS